MQLKFNDQLGASFLYKQGSKKYKTNEIKFQQSFELFATKTFFYKKGPTFCITNYVRQF